MTEINILLNFPYETEETLKTESDYLLEALQHVDFFRIHYFISLTKIHRMNRFLAFASVLSILLILLDWLILNAILLQSVETSI